MALSSPVTAPTPGSNASDSSPPPPVSPPPDTTSPPPPSTSPPPDSSPPPPSSSDSSPPPPSESESSPPPPSKAGSPPPASPSPPPPSSSTKSPPPDQTSSSPPPPTRSSSSSPPPPTTSSSSSPPPPKSSSSESPPSPPPSNNNNNSTSKNNSTSSWSPPPPSKSHSPSSSKALSPPPPSHSSSDDSASDSSSSSSSNSSSSSDKVPIIVGAVAGVALLFILMALIFVCIKRKKRKSNDDIQYFGDPPPHKVNTDYYGHGQTPSNWNNSPQMMMNHVGNVPPPPGMLGTPPSKGGWPAPPPPPHMMSSSEMSSNTSHTPIPPLSPPLGFNKSTFTYDELAAATNGFSNENLLGQGGFGFVHKGVLPSGKVVAVKSLKIGSGQGEREFQAEVEIISRVHHRHLVSLVGYCIADGQRMLVYEFVANNTLEYHLHGPDRPTMEWELRLRIAVGTAKGLAYLHEDCHPRIIHRDIKAANILIDDNWEAMVADFGLAKLSSDNFTHVSTRVMGTFGYLAPEYASSGKLTDKSDVFSFGVMLLELITGKRPVNTTRLYIEDSLVDWARPHLTRALEDGNYEELVDPRLNDNYMPHEMARMIACAAVTIRHSARRRPKMSQVVRALEGDASLEDLHEGGFRAGHSSAYSDGGSDYGASSYNEDLKKFRKMALDTQDMSEYGATSEYGLNPSSSSSDSQGMSGRNSYIKK